MDTSIETLIRVNGRLVKYTPGIVIDGLQYRTVVMPDGREWMAENLQAEQGTACFYNNDETTYGRNGKNYGRLYNWNDAIAIATRVNGWHLPSEDEWTQLANAVGGVDSAGSVLKSTTGWAAGTSTDAYRFSAYPAGLQNSGTFSNLGGSASFWTTSTYLSDYAYYYNFDTSGRMTTNFNYKKYRFNSVRLIRDL